MSTKSFRAKRITRTYRQTIFAGREQIFPLLCPVREAEWLDGWQYQMIYSDSGAAEKGAVFSTSHQNEPDTIWLVSNYNHKNYLVEFVRFTPGSRTCLLQVAITKKTRDTSYVDISYTYTAIAQQGNAFIDSFTPESFHEAVRFWEDSMNHFLETGHLLKRDL